MTARSIYAWLVGHHPRAFRDQFEKDMLWVFDETVASRGGTALILDAALSVARQWILRPRSKRARIEKPAPESGSLAAEFRRGGWYRGLTPEIHMLILWMPFIAGQVLWIDQPESFIALVRYASTILLLSAWYKLYKRRLLREPLKAPATLAHLPYRLQLEDSLKTIQWMGGVVAVSRTRKVIGVIVAGTGPVLLDVIMAAVGYPRLSMSLWGAAHTFVWLLLVARLNGYAAQTLRREIARLPQSNDAQIPAPSVGV